MVAWPVNGVDDWNTKMRTYLDVEHDLSTGVHDVETILTDTEGQYAYADVNGSPAKVYTKFLTGTLDSDSETSVAHNVTDGLNKILSVTATAYEDTLWSAFILANSRDPSPGASVRIEYRYDGTNVIFAEVGSQFQGNAYRIKIDYIL